MGKTRISNHSSNFFLWGASCCIIALTSKKGPPFPFLRLRHLCICSMPAPDKSPMLELVCRWVHRHPFRKRSCQNETLLQGLGGVYQKKFKKKLHLVEDVFHHSCTEMFITLSSTKSEHAVYINCQACNAKIKASLISLRHIQTCTLPETNSPPLKHRNYLWYHS